MKTQVEILVAEDSPTQAAQLQNLLEDNGYAVCVAANGRLALEAARVRKPDLIISDIVMPEMDGNQLCKAIKADETLRDIPLVLVTSLSSPNDLITGLGCGADSFIRKPYEEKNLISSVEYLLANQLLRQQEQNEPALAMDLGGQRHLITAEREQILDLLISTYTEAMRLNEGLNRSNQWLHGLYRIAEGLNQAEDEHAVCKMAVAGAAQLPAIQSIWITLNEDRDDRGAGRVVAASGLLDCAQSPEMLESDASIDLWAGDQVYGVMHLRGVEEMKFRDEDLSILRGVGNQVGIALERAHLRANLEKMVEERTAALRAEVIERKAAEEDAERRLEQLRLLHAIDKTIIALHELPLSLDLIVKQIATQLKVDVVNVLLYDAQNESLTYSAGVGISQEAVDLTPKRLGEGRVGRGAARGHFDYVPNLQDASDFVRAPWIQREGFVSYCGVPLIVHDELKGVLEIFHRQPLDPQPEWVEFLQALALQTAIAIAHSRLFSQSRHLLQRTQEEARKVKQIMDTVPEGVIFLNRDHHVQLTNETGEMYLSLLSGAKAGDLLISLGEYPLAELVSRARKAAWQELTISEGRHIFEMAARPMQLNSRAEGWVLILREVTYERHNQHQMQVQERLATVGQLAAGIAHDFNNLLVPIILYSELMIANFPRDSRIWSNLDKILLAANRAKELVRQILAFSRQGQLQTREPVQLQRHIKEVLKLLWASLPPTIEVRQQIAPDIGAVLANPVEIHQILMNLCTNAYHAMQRSGGVLTIHLDKITVDPDFVAAGSHLKLGPYVRLAINDTGHGIEPATIERIFDPFFTTKAQGEGAGMGLSVVYGIVMSYGGDILVESVPGKGTTFSIYLPQLATSGESEEVNEEPLVGGHEHILLVDDEEAIVNVAETLLAGLGYEVTAHTSSVDALASFRKQPEEFDLVITDLTMPQMNGIVLSQELLEIHPGLPILLISGAHENFTVETARAIGVDASLMKPFLTHELANRIRDLLDRERVH